MAGTFTSQNKVRPGAYMVFKAEHKSQLNPGERGIVAIPMALPWAAVGAVTKVTAADVVRGLSFNLIGLKTTDDEMRPLMAALQNCPTALVYRMGTGGIKAMATLPGSITVMAVYPGTLGNKITVTVLSRTDGKFDLVTTVRGLELDRQMLSAVEEYVPNGWVTLIGTTGYAFTPVAPLPTGVSALTVTGLTNVGNVTLAHSSDTDTHTLTVTNGTKVLTQSWENAAWTGSVNFEQEGVKLTFDTAQASSFSTAVTIGSIAATGLSPVAGVTLTGGTDPTLSEADDYAAFQNTIRPMTWQCMAVPSKNSVLPPLVKMFVELMRETDGKKVQAVVYDYPTADYEGIISMSQGYKIGDDTYSETDAICWMAGATAGAAPDESNTYKVVAGATDIINEMTSSQIEDALLNGQLVLSKRQDGSVVVEKDINTLHTFTEDRTYAFSKNRVIRCLDDIATQITEVFENSYIGKVDNNDDGRTLFKGDVIGYINELQSMGAIQNFEPTEDIEVLPGKEIDSVVCNLWIQPVDAMEKLYMTVVVA